MSIEKSIERLAEAVEKLTVALGETVSVSIPASDFAKAAEAVVQAEKPKPAPEPKKPKAEKPAPKAETPAPEPAERTPAAASLTDVSTALKDLMKDHGRDAAVAVLGKFKAANVKALKPGQYAGVIEAAKGYKP